MSFDAKIIKDSISLSGVRLTTFEITFPRIVLAEFNTHRMLSRNSASSRAIPIEKMLNKVKEDPYIPSKWGKNKRGMQAEVDLSDDEASIAEVVWLDARDTVVEKVKKLSDLGVHKQLSNRLLEPFLWQTVICTATEFDNFFHLRNNKDAHPDIQIIAKMMQDLYESKTPKELSFGEWHMPLVSEEEFNSTDKIDWRKVSVARCARVSYLTHDGKRDVDADIKLHDRLLNAGHMSPFEHVARPLIWQDMGVDEDAQDVFKGNFRGWLQYRKMIKNEHDILGAK